MFATGGGTGDPSVWYPVQIRVVGRALIADSVFTTTTGNKAAPGWDTNQSGAPVDAFLFGTGGALFAYQNSVSIRVGDWAATTHKAVIIQRGTGYWYLFKGGIYTKLTLMWISNLISSNMFPAYGSHTSGTAFMGRNVRIPAPTYVVAPLAYDSFTRANGALGSTETVGPDLQVIAAKAWTLQNGTIAIVSNRANVTALGGANAIATIDAGSADILIDAPVTRTAGSGGVILRYVDANNYIIGYHDGTNAKLDKIVAGATTNVLTAAATYAADRVVRVTCEGTKFRLHYNNVAIGSEGVISDAALQSSTLCGLYGTDLSVSLDNLTVWARGTEGQYAALDLQ